MTYKVCENCRGTGYTYAAYNTRVKCRCGTVPTKKLDQMLAKMALEEVVQGDCMLRSYGARSCVRRCLAVGFKVGELAHLVGVRPHTIERARDDSPV